MVAGSPWKTRTRWHCDRGLHNLGHELVSWLGDEQAVLRLPNWRECRFCDITTVDCKKWVKEPPEVMATTKNF